jgi:hypothetical protein
MSCNDKTTVSYTSGIVESKNADDTDSPEPTDTLADVEYDDVDDATTTSNSVWSNAAPVSLLSL